MIFWLVLCRITPHFLFGTELKCELVQCIQETDSSFRHYSTDSQNMTNRDRPKVKQSLRLNAYRYAVIQLSCGNNCKSLISYEQAGCYGGDIPKGFDSNLGQWFSWLSLLYVFLSLGESLDHTKSTSTRQSSMILASTLCIVAISSDDRRDCVHNRICWTSLVLLTTLDRSHTG
jgi:hypothetical protein